VFPRAGRPSPLLPRPGLLRAPAKQHGDLVWIRPYNAEPSARLLTIDLEPIVPPVVFIPLDAVALKLLARGEPILGRPVPIYSGPEDELKYGGAVTVESALRYAMSLPVATTVTSSPSRCTRAFPSGIGSSSSGTSSLSP
jgi:hypothetical protein